MATNMYDVYDVTIEKDYGYGVGKNETYPIVLCTPGGDYVGYSAKLILDFLNKGESSRLEQGILDMQNLYILYMVAVSKRDNLQRENEKLKEELEFVRGDNTKFEEDVKQLKNDLEESQRNNMELAANVKALEAKLVNATHGRKQMEWDALVAENRRLHQENTGLDLDNFIKDSVQERYLKLQVENEELKTQSSSLQKENVRLVEEREDLQKKNEYLSGSIKKICDIYAKEKAELKEQLEASSDLNMTNELANIFGEYTDAEQKNHNILIGKLAKFKDKHKLICVAGELKRG